MTKEPQVCHLGVNGGVGVNMKRVIVVRISKEAILHHNFLHLIESKVHFGCSTKCFLPDLLKRGS